MPSRKPKIRVSAQLRWMVDVDDKFQADLEKDPSAKEWYLKFLKDEYANGGYANRKPTKKQREERKARARAQDAQRRDAMNYKCSRGFDGFDVTASARSESLWAWLQDDSFTKDPLWKELVAEFREYSGKPLGGGEFKAPVPSRRRELVAEALKLLSPKMSNEALEAYARAVKEMQEDGEDDW